MCRPSRPLLGAITRGTSLQKKLVTIGYTRFASLPDSSIYQLLNRDKSTAINAAEVFLVHSGTRITLQGQRDCLVTKAGAAIYTSGRQCVCVNGDDT